VLDLDRPYAFFCEHEPNAAGELEAVATIFLTNRECPFRCLMCDLWQNTLDDRVPPGAIPRQIEYALSRLPLVQHVKLYNSGNFFDAQAIPPSDHGSIARILRPFRTVIVENHPAMCTSACVEFRDRLESELEIAIGLETIHPEILPRLNKRMTVDDFDRAVSFVRSHGIHVRVFILLRPPWLDESEGVDWALRSMRHAFDAGARVSSVIPVRAGNGIMDQLQQSGEFQPPSIRSLEAVVEAGLAMRTGRVFADLWDVDRLAACRTCAGGRADRLGIMNRTQQIPEPVVCAVCCPTQVGGTT